MAVHCSRAVVASRRLMLRHRPCPPGSGFLPLLWAAAGLCCAAAPALVGDCGKMPAVATLRPPLVGTGVRAAWGGLTPQPLPSPLPCYLPSRSPPWCPVRSSSSRSSSPRSVAQALAGLTGIYPEGGLLFCRVGVSVSAMAERRESSSSLFARSRPYWLPRLTLLPP